MFAIIVGKGLSGKAVESLFKKVGIQFLSLNSDEFDLLSDYQKNALATRTSILVLSPGVSLESNIVQWAKVNHIWFCGELELAYLFSNCNIIGITGTDGKTTVTLLTEHILNTYFSQLNKSLIFKQNKMAVRFDNVSTKKNDGLTSSLVNKTVRLSNVANNKFARRCSVDDKNSVRLEKVLYKNIVKSVRVVNKNILRFSKMNNISSINSDSVDSKNIVKSVRVDNRNTARSSCGDDNNSVILEKVIDKNMLMSGRVDNRNTARTGSGDDNNSVILEKVIDKNRVMSGRVDNRNTLRFGKVNNNYFIKSYSVDSKNSVKFSRVVNNSVNVSRASNYLSEHAFKFLFDKKAVAVGNVGVPFSYKCLELHSSDWAVTEISSFQAESFEFFTPNIAVLLNLSPDHLDRHLSMQNYANAKLKLFKNLSFNSCAVFNADDSSKSFAQDLSGRTNVFYFSRKSTVRGCFFKNGCIYFKDKKCEKIMNSSSIKLLGDFNLENVVASVLIAKLCGVPNHFIDLAVSSFFPLKHRMNLVGKFKGVSVYNASKATNAHAGLACISALNPSTVIMGGSSKNEDFSFLFKNLPISIKNIVVVGHNAVDLIVPAICYSDANVYFSHSFRDAAIGAFSLCSSNDVLALIPASASFDFFSSYEQRGDFFENLFSEVSRELPFKIQKFY